MQNFDRYFSLRGITLNTTTACNLDCSYCFEKNKTQKNMSIDDAQRIIDFVCEHFERTTLKNDPDAKLGISFFGGEPLLNFEVIKTIVNATKDKDYPVEYGVTTNLTILTDEMIDFFYENNFGVLVSIDGTRDVHNKNRCGSYDIVAQNSKRLIDAGLVFNTEARITIPPGAVHTMLDGIKNVVELGIDNIAPSLVFDQQWSKEQISELAKQVDAIFEYIINTYNNQNNKRNINIKMVNDFIELCLDVKQDDLCPCGFGKNVYISIGPDGEIGSCHQNHTNVIGKEAMVMGNILTGVLHEDRIVNLRRAYEQHTTCNGCKVETICRGGCPAENYVLNNSFNAPPKIWCQYMHIIYEATKKYQEQLLTAPNIRNRRLNIIKTNIEMSKKINNMAQLDIEDERYLPALAEVQSFIFNNERIILPSFKQHAEKFLINAAIKTAEKLLDTIALAEGRQTHGRKINH